MGIRLFPNEVNFIKEIITHPCARPWYVYLQTFTPAVIELFFVTAFFAVHAAIRANGEKSARGKEGRKGKRHTPRIRVNATDKIINRFAQKGLLVLLIVTEPLEKIGFLWLLFSAVDRFFYNWQTLLDKSDFCKEPIISGPLQRSRTTGFISVIVSGSAVILGTLEQTEGPGSQPISTPSCPRESIPQSSGSPFSDPS